MSHYRHSLADGPQPYVHFSPILTRPDGEGGLTTEVIALSPEDRAVLAAQGDLPAAETIEQET